MKRAALVLIRIADKAIGFIILIAFVVVLLMLVFFSVENKTLIQEADSEQYRVYKPTSNDQLSLEELRKINPEVIGWLIVDDTPVDYPVVQGENNSKYVNTSVFGEFSLSGALFLDSRNDPGFSDTLSVIYGHNMAGSVMFGDFYLYEDKAYFDSHRDGSLFFNGGYHAIRIIAYFEADGYDRDVYAVRMKNSERAAWLDRIRERAIHFSDPVSDNKPLLMLSTCMAGNTNGRTVLLCEVDTITDVPLFYDTQKRVDVQSVITQSMDAEFRYWIWIPVILGLIGLTVVYIVWTQKRKEGARHGRD